VQGPVDRDVIQVEPDDPVERRERSVLSASNTPASIHSSRRARSVVSDTWRSRIASMSTHDAPVTSRIRIPRKQTRPGTRGR
jgi:hypothetical protein